MNVLLIPGVPQQNPRINSHKFRRRYLFRSQFTLHDMWRAKAKTMLAMQKCSLLRQRPSKSRLAYAQALLQEILSFACTESRRPIGNLIPGEHGTTSTAVDTLLKAEDRRIFWGEVSGSGLGSDIWPSDNCRGFSCSAQCTPWEKP